MMVWGMGWEWAGSPCGRLHSRQAAVSLSLQPGRGSGISVTAREGSYCLLLIANPSCLSCGNTGTAVPAAAVGHGRAGTTTPDITQCHSYLHDGSVMWSCSLGQLLQLVVSVTLGVCWGPLLWLQGQQRALGGSSACFLLASLEPIVLTRCCSGEQASLLDGQPGSTSAQASE